VVTQYYNLHRKYCNIRAVFFDDSFLTQYDEVCYLPLYKIHYLTLILKSRALRLHSTQNLMKLVTKIIMSYKNFILTMTAKSRLYFD